MEITIRVETPDDIVHIHQLTKAAFLDAPHSSHTEQLIVDALRDAGALSVSLVAEHQQQIIGHLALSPVSISDGAKHWYGLGPISVLPEQQGKGVGAKLMVAALDALKQSEANGCVLLGDPAYYQRFGFKPLAGLNLADVPAEYFQAKVIKGTVPQGEVTYHPGFMAEK